MLKIQFLDRNGYVWSAVTAVPISGIQLKVSVLDRRA